MKSLKWYGQALLIAVFAEACATPVTATSTPHMTATPSIPKTWLAPPILVEFYEEPGLEYYLPLFIPQVVLYADGHMIVTHQDLMLDQYSIVEAQLSRDEVCLFLEQFAQDGFFDPEISKYHSPAITDQHTIHITVKAWRSQSVAADGLDWALDDTIPQEYKEGFVVPPGLAATYARLRDYRPPNATPYMPDQLALQIRQDQPRASETVSPWPFPTLALGELVRESPVALRTIILDGEDAKLVYELFGDDWGQYFDENGLSYLVTIVPQLPLHLWKLDDSNFWPSSYSYSMVPAVELNCD